MQKLQTHLRWFRSFRRLRISGLLIMLLIVALINASLLLIAKQPDTVEAQTIPTPKTQQSAVVDEKPVETPQQAPAEATPSPQPAPQPAPTPAPAPAPAQPAPAYDKVTIGSIGLSSQLVTVGTTATNAIDVHPSLVGWWKGSALPGTPGLTFLDGHNPGVFSKLPNIQVGAQISITKANGETFNYTVVHRETVQLAGIDMRKALTVHEGGAEGLNLMTCVGTFNNSTGTTDQRLVVYAIRS